METRRVIDRRGVPKPSYWTALAKECYQKKTCEGCFYKEFFETRGLKCQMKLSVIESIKVLGVPEVKDDDENEYKYDR